MKLTHYIFLFFLALPAQSFACKCKELSIQKNFNNSSMVVYATVKDFIPSPSNEGGTAVLLIDNWWKSNSPQKIVVNSLTSCGFNFEANKSYLLFLNQESNGLFYTDKCSGNKELKSKDEFTTALEKLK